MYDNFDGPGFDWNGNGHRDSVDDYMNYRAANDRGGGGSGGSGGGSGCGCLMFAGMVLVLLYLLGSCS